MNGGGDYQVWVVLAVVRVYAGEWGVLVDVGLAGQGAFHGLKSLGQTVPASSWIWARIGLNEDLDFDFQTNLVFLIQRLF
jgi:hypothetical protein